jgi:hypothetical protein
VTLVLYTNRYVVFVLNTTVRWYLFSVLADGGVLGPLWQVGGICSLYWQVGGFCLITGREEVLVFLNWQVGK